MTLSLKLVLFVLNQLSFQTPNRLSRGRINDAFQLNDKTLEFQGIPATLAPPVEQPVTVWLVVYGVVMGIVVLVGAYLVISGIRSRKT